MPINRKELIKQIAPELIALVLLLPLIIIIGAIATRLPIFRAPAVETTPAPANHDQLSSDVTPDTPPSIRDTATISDTAPVSSSIEMFIISSGKTERFDIPIDEQITVADLLLKASDQGLQLSTKDYGGTLGIFVESLNNVPNNPDRQLFWQLYINNELSPVGASTATVEEEDSVTWKLEPPQDN